MPRRSYAPGALLTLLAVFATVFAACSGNQRQKTLRVSYASVKSACDGLDAFDRAKQEAIIDGADPATTSKAEVQAKLDAHIARMDKAYAACRLAALAIADASMSKDDLTLQTALAEAAKLYAEVKKLKGGP